MKQRPPHPYFDLFDKHPELRPSETRESLDVLVKRKRRPKDAKPIRGDMDFYCHCTMPDREESTTVDLHVRSAIPSTAAEYVKLLIRDLKPTTLVWDDSAAEAKAYFTKL